MNTKTKIPVTFAPVSELNSWEQPIINGEEASRRFHSVQMREHAGLTLRTQVEMPSRIARARLTTNKESR